MFVAHVEPPCRVVTDRIRCDWGQLRVIGGHGAMLETGSGFVGEIFGLKGAWMGEGRFEWRQVSGFSRGRGIATAAKGATSQ